MLLALLIGCGTCPEVGDDVLFLGDSVLGWNEKSCRSIPSNAAVTADLAYLNAAKNGALMSDGEDSIHLQHTEGDWPWVVIAGGANDLNSRCDCGPCETVLDNLATSDGAGGVTADLVDGWTERGSQVLLLGYYPVPDGALYGFGDCFDTISELDRRYSLIAEQRENVQFFDLGDLLSPENASGRYAFDKAHPSPKGARELGAAVGELLK